MLTGALVQNMRAGKCCIVAAVLGRDLSSSKNKSDSSLNYEGLIKKNLSENYFSTIESGSCYSDLSNLSCGNIDCCIIINPANKVLQEASLIVNSTGGHSKIIDLKDLKIFIAGNKFVDKMVSEMIEESF